METWERRDPSPNLLLAQQKLIRLRRQHEAQSSSPELKLGSLGQSALVDDCISDEKPSLPNHIGWGSAPFSQAIRRSLKTQDLPSKGVTRSCKASNETAGGSDKKPRTPTSVNDQVKLHPDLAMSMLGKKMVAAGRIWLLLQCIDESGRGWLPLDLVRDRLTTNSSDLRICGRRQLRKLLAAGEDVFWIRGNDRIWMRSVAKVAVSLGTKRLHLRPVTLPVSHLLEKIGTVRAHFFASFHSSRHGQHNGRVKPNGGQQGVTPLSRASLQEITSVKPRTQRHYETRAGIKTQANYALVRESGLADSQEQAWQLGQAWFRYIDHTGKYGKQGQAYSVWRLPNSYRGPHNLEPLGRQKKINHEIADLFMKGMTGNDNVMDDKECSESKTYLRRFYRSGATAVANYNRQSECDIYWLRNRSPGDRFLLWNCLPRQ